VNTTKTHQEDLTRRELLRGAFASAVIVALPSCMRGNGGPCIASANSGRDIPLFLGNNALSQDSITNMRNDVMNLRGLLEKMIDTAGSVWGRREFDFSGCGCVARATLELVEGFMRESELPAPERMEYLQKRWEFVHAQLLNSIRMYRDGIEEAGMSTRGMGRNFGVEIGDI
jgi:hypothetical protein